MPAEPPSFPGHSLNLLLRTLQLDGLVTQGGIVAGSFLAQMAEGADLLFYRPECLAAASTSALTPGSSSPARNASMAPPAVLTWDNR